MKATRRRRGRSEGARRRSGRYSARLSARGGGHRDFRMSEDFFLQVLSSLEDYAVFTVDRRGIVTSWFEGARRIFGWTEDEIIGRSADALFTPEAVASGRPQRELKGAEEHGRSLDETWHVRKDGALFWAYGLVFPLRDRRGRLRGFTKIARDLSERREAETRLLAERAKLELVIDSAPAVVTYVTRDRRFAFANRAVGEFLGLPIGEIVGRGVEELLGPELTARLRDPIERALGGEELEFDLEIEDASGQRRFFRVHHSPHRGADGRVEGYVAYAHDMTERSRMEEALRESEARFRTLANSLPAFVWVADAKGEINFLNDRFAEYTGIPVSGAMGEAWAEAVHPEDRPAAFETLGRSISTAMGFEMELRIRRADGRYRWFVTRARPALDADGKVLAWYGTTTDIHDRREALRALADAQQELALRAERLELAVAERTAHLQKVIEQLEAFSYTASHDLRAPVRAIQGYAFFLLKRMRGKTDPESLQLLERIEASAVRMDRLVQDLLQYSRAGRAGPASGSVDLDAIVAHVVENYGRSRGVAIEVRRPLGRVRAHESLMTQIVSNLVDNGIKFVPQDREPRLRIWCERPAPGRVRLVVEDNGIGIAPEHQARVFAPFVRVYASRFEGTGIGLAIVRNAAEAMGGKAGLESSPGQGSRFWVELPEGA